MKFQANRSFVPGQGMVQLRPSSRWRLFTLLMLMMVATLYLAASQPLHAFTNVSIAEDRPANLANNIMSATPTVNGLFYGDGDDSLYQLYATSQYGSGLYYYFDNPTLYVALVVDRGFNDNVFDRNGQPTPYNESAGWNNRPAGQLWNSEYAEFELTCGATTFTWQQSYAYRSGGIFVSNHLEGAGGGIAPTGIVSSSSFAWNINNYQAKAPADRPWNMYVHGAGDNQWKSPWITPGNTVIGLEGYPASGPITYSPTFEYEWPMVYEWAVDLTTPCDGSSVFVIAGSSHHSPSKLGPQDDPFPPQDTNNPENTLTDFGDLPNIYGTLSGSNGARHTIVIGGAYLGANPPDNEVDGLPSADALGDDQSGTNDEDGIVFLTPFVPGGEALIQVTAGTAGYLSAFIDFNNDGTLDPVTLILATGPAAVIAGTIGDTYLSAPGVYTLRISIPADATGVMYSRFRFTNAADQGGNSPVGRADTGEVEDYALASLGDRVWLDANGNGIQDDDEPGVANVMVRLLDHNGNPVLDADNNPVTTITDSNGNYEFPGLPPGNYRVAFVAPGSYSFTLPGVGDDGDLDSDPDETGVTTTFALAPGQLRTDVDAGLVAPTAVTLATITASTAASTGLLVTMLLLIMALSGATLARQRRYALAVNRC